MPRASSSLACACLALAACRELPDADAVKLVEAYNARVIEAFRAGDAALVEPVAGPEEAKKITGLVGVKLDLGITLDAKLTALHVLGVERSGGEVQVSTDETWAYRDRRIGTGEQVGEASTDHYVMRYHLQKLQGRWVVARIEWTEPPQVGRARAETRIDVDAAHGIETRRPPAPDPAPAPPREEKPR
jgi:hypothetical protein